MIGRLNHIKKQIDELVDVTYDSGFYAGNDKYAYTPIHTESIAERNTIKREILAEIDLIIDEFITSLKGV